MASCLGQQPLSLLTTGGNSLHFAICQHPVDGSRACSHLMGEHSRC